MKRALGAPPGASGYSTPRPTVLVFRNHYYWYVGPNTIYVRLYRSERRHTLHGPDCPFLAVVHHTTWHPLKRREEKKLYMAFILLPSLLYYIMQARTTELLPKPFLNFGLFLNVAYNIT